VPLASLSTLRVPVCMLLLQCQTQTERSESTEHSANKAVSVPSTARKSHRPSVCPCRTVPELRRATPSLNISYVLQIIYAQFAVICIKYKICYIEYKSTASYYPHKRFKRAPSPWMQRDGERAPRGAGRHHSALGHIAHWCFLCAFL
jgi:hypothetical protein